VAYRAFRSPEQLTAQALSENPTPALGSAVPTSAVSLRGVRATPMLIYTVYVYFESPLNFGTARLLAKTSIMSVCLDTSPVYSHMRQFPTLKNIITV